MRTELVSKAVKFLKTQNGTVEAKVSALKYAFRLTNSEILAASMIAAKVC